MPLRGAISRRTFLRSVTFAAGGVLTGCEADNDQPAPGHIRLTQWYHQYGEGGTHAAALRYAAEYTQLNPLIEIKVVWVPGSYTAKLSTGLIAGQGPDLFETNLSSVLGFITAGNILPLDSLMSDADRQDFDPLSLSVNTVNGRLYGIPEVLDVCLLYYRPSVLKAAGIQPPTTMDELIAASKALSSIRTKGLFVGNDGGITALTHVAPWSAGANIMSGQKIAFDTPQTVAAYEKVKELYNTGSLLIGAPTDWWVPDALTEELAAMQWTGLWALKDIAGVYGDDIGVVPWPALSSDPGCTPVTPISCWAECINANSPHLEETKNYAKWLWIDNKKNQADWCESYGLHIPPRRSVAASAQIFSGDVPAAALENSGRYGRVIPPTWTSAMDMIVLNALARIVRENSPAADEVHAAAVKCAAELNDQSTS